MTRRAKKSPKNYPNLIVFDENLEGVGNAFVEADLRSLPAIAFAIKSVKDHILAMSLDERTVFFTCDKNWSTRQPPYKHGGIIVLDTGNLPLLEKVKIVRDFLVTFQRYHKALDILSNRRFRLTKNSLFEVSLDGNETKLF